MLLSLFTPTHNPQYLDRLARSIANQTFTKFEWVIVPNGEPVRSTSISPKPASSPTPARRKTSANSNGSPA